MCAAVVADVGAVVMLFVSRFIQNSWLTAVGSLTTIGINTMPAVGSLSSVGCITDRRKLDFNGMFGTVHSSVTYLRSAF